MQCPFCEASETKVIDSRLVNEGEQVRRRRECLLCLERFTTFETAVVTMPQIVKQGGHRQAFCEEKLRRGMQRALEKRPVSTDELDQAISKVKSAVRKHADKEIHSQFVGEQVMAELRKLDGVAYIRFASVYQSFQDLEAFMLALEQLVNQPESSSQDSKSTN